jgi:hypothetical protein
LPRNHSSDREKVQLLSEIIQADVAVVISRFLKKEPASGEIFLDGRARLKYVTGRKRANPRAKSDVAPNRP